MRLLGTLESTGIFIRTSPRVFGNTPTSKCLRKEQRVNFSDGSGASGRASRCGNHDALRFLPRTNLDVRDRAIGLF
jgi:hypothetical protein